MKNKLTRVLKRAWRLARPLLLIVIAYRAAAWAAAAAPPAFLLSVSPWEVGVRQDNFGGGLEARDLPPGAHFELPGLSAIQVVDMRGWLTSFGGEVAAVKSARSVAHPALDIRTFEGQTAQVDLSAAWHITPGAANRLVKGAMLATLESKVADRLGSSLRLRLAALSSEDWFDTRRRTQLAEELEGELAAELRGLFVELDGLYIRGVRFSADYEKKLQEKQIAHQMALLHDAKGRVDAAEAEVGKLMNETDALEAKVLAEWLQHRETVQATYDIELATLKAETETYVTQLRATVEAEYKLAVAEGEQAVKLAQTEASRLRLEALGTEGGRIWLAQRAASKLAVGEVWLDSRDPSVPSMLDLDELVDLMYGANRAEPVAKREAD